MRYQKQSRAKDFCLYLGCALVFGAFFIGQPPLALIGAVLVVIGCP